MAKDVQFNIRLNIDGKEQIVTASTNVKKLAEELEIAQTKSTKFRDTLLEFNQVGQSFQYAMQGLQQLTGLMQTYTAANTVQAEAETKLATVMRQRMNATDEDIKAIKELASAQQELGVIGDEVQLAGLQQVATFTTQRETLELLLPAMNNLMAQQYGLNASTSDAINIANKAGKALMGQTGELREAGITFTEAQEKVMKYGTETQKAAMFAQVVTENVGNMNEVLAKTDAGKAQQTANTIGDMKEQVGALFAGVEPVIVAFGEVGTAIGAAATMAKGLQGVVVFMKTLKNTTVIATVATYGQAAASKIAAAATGLWGNQVLFANRMQIAWTFGAKGFVIRAVAMRAAIAGLMTITGVGLAILAVSSIVSLFTDKTADATEEMKKAEAETKKLTDANNQENTSLRQSRAELQINIAKLKEFKGSKQQEKKLVDEMNDTYGETMGYFDSVSKWYDALIKNSEAYCRQMVIEAKTRELANQIATKEEQLRNFRQNGVIPEGEVQQHLDDLGVDGITGGGGSVESWARKTEAEIADLTGQMKKAVEEAAKISFSVKGSTTRPTGGDKQLVENAKSYKDLANNVAYYQQEIEKADIADTERIATLMKAKNAAENAVQAFKDFADSLDVPAEAATLEDYDKQLQQLQKRRKTATAETIAGIDAEINKLEEAKRALEDTSAAALQDEEIRTYDQLNRKLAYYNRLLNAGDEAQRVFAQNGINRLNKMKAAWDEALDAMELPATNDTLEDIDASISFYTSRQQREDADQIQRTQAIIDGLTAKKKTLQLGIELPQMQKEIEDIEALTGKERAVKISGIGFDELTSKIRELNNVLNDVQNPVTSDQRKQIEGMIQTYERWRKESISAFGSFRDGWNGIKGIGGGIESVTEALEGNGSAWQKITSIVDAFIQLYESINAIVGIINLMTAATTGHTAAKTAEGAAVAATGVATGAAIATEEAAAVAMVPVIVANKAATASYMELASAMYFAAHAYIPFGGFGIAAGFAAAAVATVQAIAAMPFAEGGIVTGPTFAIVGEYPGASNNPEVIAPLDKLRGILGNDGEDLPKKVRFVIDGRTLVGLIEKENKHNRRS